MVLRAELYALLRQSPAIDALLSLMLRVARLLRDNRELNPLRIEFERAEPSPSEPFRRYFRAPIKFGARTNAIEFAPHDVDAPCRQGMLR